MIQENSSMSLQDRIRLNEILSDNTPLSPQAQIEFYSKFQMPRPGAMTLAQRNYFNCRFGIPQITTHYVTESIPLYDTTEIEKTLAKITELLEKHEESPIEITNHDDTVYTDNEEQDKDETASTQSIYQKASALTASALLVSQLDSPIPGPADVAAAGMVVAAAGMVIYGITKDLYTRFSKGGKQNIRDTELSPLPDEEIQKIARDKRYPQELRKRAEKEEKRRKLRNIQKRKGQ